MIERNGKVSIMEFRTPWGLVDSVRGSESGFVGLAIAPAAEVCSAWLTKERRHADAATPGKPPRAFGSPFAFCRFIFF